jgi:hypothetical protein
MVAVSVDVDALVLFSAGNEGGRITDYCSKTVISKNDYVDRLPYRQLVHAATRSHCFRAHIFNSFFILFFVFSL